MTRLLALFISIGLSFSLAAQQVTMQSNTDQYQMISQVEESLTQEEFFSVYAQKMGLSPADEMVLKGESEGRNGYAHYKYTQVYKGIPVYGKAYNLHVKDGKVRSANGNFAAHLKMAVVPTLTAEAALQAAMLDFGADSYPWESPQSKSTRVHKPQPQLCIIDKGLTHQTGIHKLVYRIELVGPGHHDGQEYFVDAHTGQILHKIELFHSCGVPGQCETRYYGTQELIVDSISADNYILFDETRGLEGQGVVNFDNTYFSSETRNFDTENDGYLKGAMDAHFCATKLYDVMRDQFDWLGVDGANGSFKVGVYARGQEDLVNAFWNGEMAWIGNGDCNNGPLATMEVVAHELMHGMIDFTSDLTYSDESGAINESMADVIGQVMEYIEDEQNFSWSLNSFVLNEDVEPFRIMDNPKAKEHPALYKGEFWRDGADVHINSSIGNLLYVLLSDGRQGANELGDVYDILGMGKLEAAQFLFHINRNYLTPSSNYDNYYQASLLAAEEWWSGDQAVVENLKAAWGYVGLPTVSEVIYDLSIDSDGFYTNCGFGTSVSTYFDITNVGIEDYAANRNATVVVTEGFGVGEFLTEVAITDTILVGETLRVELDSIYETEDQFAIINYTLTYPDDQVESNNDEDDIISTTEFINDDISIVLNPVTVGCFETEAEIEFFLVNRSCEPIDIGTEVSVTITNRTTGEVYIDENIVTEDRIIPNGRISFVRRMEVEEPSRFEMEAEVVYGDDPNPINNNDIESFSAIATAGSDYFNGFDNEDDVFDGLGLETATDFPETTVSFQQENYFWATGIFDDNDDVLCAEPSDNFSEGVGFFTGISAALTACVDLSNDDQPSVNFNLIQFRNDNIAFPTLLSSALEVNWGSSDDERVFIFGQEEGESIPHQISLPPNYVGPLEFKFLTLTGNDNPNDLFDFDSQLIDNLHFGNSVSTSEVDNQVVKVFPNPANAQVFVASGERVVSIDVIDLKGRLVMHTTKDHLDVSQLAEGFYRLEVTTEIGQKFQEALVVVSP